MKRVRTFTHAISLSTLLVIAPAALHSQFSVPMPQRGVYPNGSYNFDQIEAINQANGILTLTIPLTSMPLGRSGMSVPVNLVYSSALFDTLNEATWSNGIYMTYQQLQNSYWGGWSIGGFTYALVLDQPSTINCSFVQAPYMLSVVLPDGSHHPLKLYDIWDDDGDSRYWYEPGNGGKNLCTNATYPLSPMPYYTSDGSYIKVQVNTNSGPTWTIYMPDGTTASGTGIGLSNDPPLYANSIADRNGNQINIQWHPSTTVTAVLTDSVGRSISISGLNVSQTGFNGAPLSWTTGGATTVSVQNLSSCEPYGCSPVTGGGIGWLQVPSDSGTLQYQFTYDSTLGVLKTLTLPAGAQTKYSWYPSAQTGYSAMGKQVIWVDKSDGGNTQRTESWTYNYAYTVAGTCGTNCTQITQPDGGVQTIFFHSVNNMGDPLDNLPIKQVAPDGSTTEYQWYQNRPLGGQGYDPSNPYQVAVIHSVASSGSPTLASAEVRSVDKNGNLVGDLNYDWIAYSSIQHDSTGMVSGGYTSGSLLKSTTNTNTVYTPTAGNGTESISDNNNAYWNPASPKLLHLLARTDLTGAGPGAITENSYDGNGNRTQQRRWDSTKVSSQPTSLNSSNASITNYTFDSYGNVASLTDPRGTVTTYNYDSNHLNLSSKIQNSNGNLNTASLTTSYTFDFDSGLMTSQTDPNGVLTDYSYDAMGRQTLLDAAVATSAENETQTTYEDSNLRVVVKKDQNSKGSGELVSVTDYDQLGRVRLTRQLECSAGSASELGCTAQSPDDDTAGIKIQTRYMYSGSNSYKLVSNPYREAVSSSATTDCSGVYTSCAFGWTATKMDQNGRVISVQSFDGSGVPAPWGSNSDSMGTLSSSYNAQKITLTDQAGVSRTNTLDGLGRLASVADASGTTTYTYDSLDNPTNVSENSQGRAFIYDSLKRLGQVTTPESGVITYTYDANANLMSRKDNRGTQTSYVYDALNRVSKRSYSDSTPTVQFTYDTATNGKGRLAEVNTNGMTAINYTAYDPMGRVSGHNQQTNGQTYSLSYAYNLAGALTSETYPSGRVVSTSYDGSNRPSSVSGSVSGAQTTYVSQDYYFPNNTPNWYWYGNGIFPVRTLNSRLQPVTLYATYNNNANNFYFMVTPYWGAGNDNGNLQSSSEYVGNNVPWGQWTQYYNESFYYDGVNRLSTASDSNAACGGICWSQGFSYDSYGSVWVSSNSGVPLASYTPTTNVYSASTNHNNTQNYDLAGNQTSLNGGTVAYDAENRMTSLTDPPSLGSAVETYGYDGNGRRVMKVAPGAVQTVYVYDAFGALTAEYTNGSMTAVCATCYFTYDHLGSVRMITDRSSPPNVISRHDYLPFGQEVIGYADRGGFGAVDNITQRFTGKERDLESGLDYFGTRYYSSAFARWMATDRLNLTDDRVLNPINTLNKYIYGGNNPLKYIDPDGQDITLFYNRDLTGTGHIFLVAVNQNSGRVAGLDFNPSEEAGVLPGVFGPAPSVNLGLDRAALPTSSKDSVLNNFASLTISTTPEQADEVIDWINKFSQNLPGFDLWTQNCTTACSEALHTLGIETGNPLTPEGLWDSLFPKYSRTGDLATLGHYPAQPGQEYGTPGIPGATPSDLFDLYFQLWIFQQQANQPPPVQACVTTYDSASGTTTTTCD